MTLDDLCDLYLAEGAGHKKPPRCKADRGRIKNHIVPLLGPLQDRPHRPRATSSAWCAT